MDWSAHKLENREEGPKKRFEMSHEGHTAFVDYIINKQGVIYLTHTEVPPAMEGMGMGSAIVEKVLHHIRNTDLKMAPLCPFVAAYLKSHPGAAEGILAPGFNIG